MLNLKVSWSRLVGMLGIGTTLLTVLIAAWLGADILSFIVNPPDQPDTGYHLRAARALKKARLKAVRGPEIVYVYETTPEVDQEIRDRHRPTVGSGGGIQAQNPKLKPVRGLEGALDGVNLPQDWLKSAVLLDMRDLEIACSGVTYEVACWLGADGVGQITVAERPLHPTEKVRRTIAGLRDLVKFRNVIEAGLVVDPTAWQDDWRAWGAWEPVSVANTSLRVELGHRNKDGVGDTSVLVGGVWRKSLRAN